MKLFGNKRNAKKLEKSSRPRSSASGSPRRSQPESRKRQEERRRAPAVSEQRQGTAPAAPARRPRKKKKAPAWQKAVIIIAVILVAIIMVLLAILKISFKPPAPPPPDADTGQNKPSKTTTQTVTDRDEEGNEITYEVDVPATVNANVYNVLVVGMDRVGANTDTMMLMSYNAEKKAMSVLSLPRDTLANINSRYSRKLNAVYASGGITGLVDAVEDLVGFTVDYYICVDLEGFATMVDAIGGIEYDIPFRMYYSDPAQNLLIDFQPGPAKLSGQQCCNLLRWRQNNGGVKDATASSYSAQGDLGRIQLQQKFLKEVLSQMIRVKNIGQIGTLSKVMKEYVETNLSVGEIAWLGLQALNNLSSDSINFMTIPGEGQYFDNLSYYVIHVNSLLEMVNTYFNPYTDAKIEKSDLDIVGISNGSIVSLTGKSVRRPGTESISASTDPEPSDPEAGDDDVNGADTGIGVTPGTDPGTEPGTGSNTGGTGSGGTQDPGIGLSGDPGETETPGGTGGPELPGEPPAGQPSETPSETPAE